MSNPVVSEIKSKWRGVRPFERHSLVLAVAGVVYIFIGWSYFRTEPTQTRLEALEYALYWVDYNQWGLVWIFVGVLAIISSRWPPISHTWGYIVLTGQSAAWGLFYGAGVLFAGTPTSNLSAFLSWGLIGFLWWAISGLVNPQAQKILWDRITDLQEENLILHQEVIRLRAKE